MKLRCSINNTNQNRRIEIYLIKNEYDKVVDVVPVLTKKKKIKFDVKARILFSKTVNMIDITGSKPLLPKKSSYFEQFFDVIDRRFPKADGIYMDSVLMKSYLWKFLSNNGSIRNKYLMHIPEGRRRHFGIKLQETYSDYIKSFSRKRRAELKRRRKVFKEKSNGKINIARIDDSKNVRKSLSEAAYISTKSWQMNKLGNRIDVGDENCARLKILAERKKLRSYILYCKNEPCAFRLGYQYGDMYVSAETGYNLDFKAISPGKVLTLLMIEDFTLVNPIKYIDFGIGYAQWKRDLCNNEYEDASIVLLTPIFAERFHIKVSDL